eukprot:jgi/Tetstr1/448644/TSEL_035889.t1
MGATSTSRSWTLNWFKDTSAEVPIYLYIELHKASLLTGKDFFDDPKGPLLACLGKIKDVELDSAGRYRICLEPYPLGLCKETMIDVVFERLVLHAIQTPLSSQPRFQSYYAWTLVERNVLAQALRGFADVHKNGNCYSIDYEPLALTMANFKDLVAAFEGGEKPKLADASSYEPEIDVIIKNLGSRGALQANIDGNHRREAKRMVKENDPEIYESNKGICFTSDKMYIGLSPEVGRYMSMKLNEAGHTFVGDKSMDKLMVSNQISHIITKLTVGPNGRQV